jgi:hypothetical protein
MKTGSAHKANAARFQENDLRRRRRVVFQFTVRSATESWSFTKMRLPDTMG